MINRPLMLDHDACEKICIQAFVGITALLAAFPPCLGDIDSSEEHQPTHPLTSGSVCRVRDSLDFLSVSGCSVGYLLVEYFLLHVLVSRREFRRLLLRL